MEPTEFVKEFPKTKFYGMVEPDIYFCGRMRETVKFEEVNIP